MTNLENSQPQTLLEWQVHLRKENPQRMPLLLLSFVIAGGCVWGIFGSPLPALVAIILLIGSTNEYLFPIKYRLTTEGIHADSLTGRNFLKWKEIKRSIPAGKGTILTTLETPSRLDNFRGIHLRFAPNGEQGDRNSAMDILSQQLPNLFKIE